MRTSVRRHAGDSTSRTPPGRTHSSPGRAAPCTGEERGVTRPVLRLPGFQTYPTAATNGPRLTTLPGFETHRYRDLRHTGGWGSARTRTGISGTRLPGVRAPKHWEVGHIATGIRGTTGGRDTGIASIKRPVKPRGSHAKPGSNSVFLNSRDNTTTSGALISGGGGR